ncbi:unnamed protein product [Arabis nemorensis]|uniref:Protein SCAR n=1 Tax=Arabis nemorensis TaxID=586526 RepID=A0A565CGQ5_9BRAS|nr:unnamed protein product [Arabis nemorensis]
MTLTRFQIRNEYGLADKELYQAADKEDPEALLEGASMAGLVGVLRQLGDLAEFAAEVFRCLHEELMTSAARGHGLAMRLQQLETEFPSIEIPILSQTDHSTFFYDPGKSSYSGYNKGYKSCINCYGVLFLLSGLGWHPNLQTQENLISPRNLPRCIMDSYEECRGPPQLFLLDKFDVVGSGSCLKRYSDPSLLKTHTGLAVVATSKLSKDERPRKPKKKVSHTISGETPGDSRTSHAKLHQLFLLEHVENGHRNPEFHVKLKRRQLNGPPSNSSYGTGYMEKFLKNSSPYCERVHGTLDQSSPAMETEVTVCSVQEDLPIPSLVYSNCEDTRKYNKMEVPQEITVNERSLPNIEGGPAICLERSSSVNVSCNANNDTTDSEAKKADIDDKACCNLEFPGFGQTQMICTNAVVTETEVVAQNSNVLHHSTEEGESSPLRSSPGSKLHKAEGSAAKIDMPFSQMTPEIDSAGMETLEVEQTPFSLSCNENPLNLSKDSGSSLELKYNKENADEIGLKSSEACEVFEVRRDPMVNISPEAQPENLSKLTQVPLDASENGTRVLLTNYVEDHHSQHVFNVETDSEISLSGLVEDQFSSIEALEPENISSEADLSIPDSKSSLQEIPAALESDCLLPNQDISTFDNFEDLSLAAVSKEDETNSQDGSSMNIEQSGHISTFEISSENGSLMSDTPRDLHRGNENLSVSSWQEEALANPDLAETPSYPGQEDPEPMSIVADDNGVPEVPMLDTQRHGTCFTGDVDHENQIGLNNKDSETVHEIDLENINDPQESLLGTQECLSPEYCMPTQDQEQESLSETGSANPITASPEPLPCLVSTQDVLVGVQGSPSEETLTCDEKLFPTSVTEIEALHAPLQEIFTPLNGNISESALSMDLTDQENRLEVSPESMVAFSTSLHETPHEAPEITPPLPPLPPTQWWMGKLVETETQFSPVASLGDSGNNSFYTHRDENTQNGSVQVTDTQYPSEASVEAVSTAAQISLSEPSEATEEQSFPAVNGTSDSYMHKDESTLKKESFASVSLLTAEATLEAESADWRTEAMALEWFSQNLREHTNPNPARLEEEPQLDENEKAGKLPRDKDSLVIGIDRSMLRKVPERNKTQVGARVDENDSLLEIIRSKSFNLRPADASVRPNFQVAVPKTNLKAMAGSDEDHDSDSWSE